MPPSAPPPGSFSGGFTPPPAQPYSGGSQLQLAQPINRIVAALIDGIGWGIITVPILFMVGDGPGGTSFNTGTFIATVISTVGYFLYQSLMIGATGTTLGGMVMKIKVVTSTGAPVTNETAFKRSAYILVQLIPCCIGNLIGLVLAIWGLIALFTQERRQTPWDQFADTIVVER